MKSAGSPWSTDHNKVPKLLLGNNGENSGVSVKAMGINDDGKLTNKQREFKLKKLFESHIKLTFKGELVPEKKKA